MDYILLFIEEEENETNKIRKRNLNLLRRRLKDTQDPFDIADNTFIKLYRLSI